MGDRRLKKGGNDLGWGEREAGFGESSAKRKKALRGYGR